MKNFWTPTTILQLGLACVFVANALIALFTPDEFQELVTNSFVVSILPVSAATFVWFIAFNDFMVAALLAIGWCTRWVARYATLWLIGVILVVGIWSFEALEHVGFVAMALVLATDGLRRMRS